MHMTSWRPSFTGALCHPAQLEGDCSIQFTVTFSPFSQEQRCGQTDIYSKHFDRILEMVEGKSLAKADFGKFLLGGANSPHRLAHRFTRIDKAGGHIKSRNPRPSGSLGSGAHTCFSGCSGKSF
jgi:hypothetical protein